LARHLFIVYATRLGFGQFEPRPTWSSFTFDRLLLIFSLSLSLSLLDRCSSCFQVSLAYRLQFIFRHSTRTQLDSLSLSLSPSLFRWLAFLKILGRTRSVCCFRYEVPTRTGSPFTSPSQQSPVQRPSVRSLSLSLLFVCIRRTQSLLNQLVQHVILVPTLSFSLALSPSSVCTRCDTVVAHLNVPNSLPINSESAFTPNLSTRLNSPRLRQSTRDQVEHCHHKALLPSSISLSLSLYTRHQNSFARIRPFVLVTGRAGRRLMPNLAAKPANGAFCLLDPPEHALLLLVRLRPATHECRVSPTELASQRIHWYQQHPILSTCFGISTPIRFHLTRSAVRALVRTG
jgi:hypothetical protein